MQISTQTTAPYGWKSVGYGETLTPSDTNISNVARETVRAQLAGAMALADARNAELGILLSKQESARAKALKSDEGKLIAARASVEAAKSAIRKEQWKLNFAPALAKPGALEKAQNRLEDASQRHGKLLAILRIGV